MFIVESGYFRFKNIEWANNAIALFKNNGYDINKPRAYNGVYSHIDSGYYLVEFICVSTEIMEEICNQIPSEHLHGKSRERIKAIGFNKLKADLDMAKNKIKEINTMSKEKRTHSELIMQWVDNPDINVYIFKKDSEQGVLDEFPQWLSNEFYAVGEMPETSPIPKMVCYSPHLQVKFNEPLNESPIMNEVFWSIDLGVGVYSDTWTNSEKQMQLLHSGFIQTSKERAERQYLALTNLLILEKQ